MGAVDVDDENWIQKSRRLQTGIFSWDDAIRDQFPEKGHVGFRGAEFGWDGSGIDFQTGGGMRQDEMLKWGFMALGLWVIITVVGK